MLNSHSEIPITAVLLIALTGLALTRPVMADSFHQREAEFASGTGNTIYLVA